MNPGQKRSNPAWMVHLAIVGAGAVWGANNVLIKYALGGSIHPLAFNAVRLSFASSVIMLVLWIAERDLRVDRQALWRTIWVGLCGHTAYQVCYITGINLTVAGRTGVILAASPALVALAGQIMGTEMYAPIEWGGIVASLAGIVMMTVPGAEIGGRMAIGDALILGAALCWTAYTIGARPLLEKYSPLKVTALTMAIGTVPLVFYAIPYMLSQDWGAVPPASWGVMAFSAVFALVINYIIWSWGIQAIGSGRTAIYRNFSPVITTVLGCALLGESWTPLHAAGAVLVLTGVSLVRGQARAPADSK